MQIHAIVAEIRPIELQQHGRTTEYIMTGAIDAFIHQYGSLANPEKARKARTTRQGKK